MDILNSIEHRPSSAESCSPKMDEAAINEDVLRFFRGHEEALPIYEAFHERLAAELGYGRRIVQKTQISYYMRRFFACVSFTPVRRKAYRPEIWLTVSFGLDHRIDSPRIDGAVEPYPKRWTHHVMLGDAAEVDDELMVWIAEAASFSAAKR